MLKRCGTILLFWLIAFAKGIANTPLNWCLGLWNDMTSPVGYRGIVVVIAAYVGVYSIMEASHERQMNLAAFERNMLITMVSSGNRSSFIAAMKNFGPTQNMTAYKEPSLLEPWSWWEETRPNVEPLALWAVHRLGSCTPDECGETDDETAHVDREYRVDLNNANLQDSVLPLVNLSRSSLFAVNLQNASLLFTSLRESDLSMSNIQKADFTMANLQSADLTSANLKDANLEKAKLQGADLGDANLEGANLEGANLEGANLWRANFTGVRGLQCNVLKAAEDWQMACRDAELACGADIPDPETCK